jgi:hypothetical protein
MQRMFVLAYQFSPSVRMSIEPPRTPVAMPPSVRST